MRKILALAAFLAGCGGATPPEPRTFDLGLNAPSTPVPPVRIGLVRAVAPFDSSDMHYRLVFRNAAEIGAFANSRWAASPSEMLRKQILRARSEKAGEKAGRCTLDIEIHEFTQVFASKESSEARIELRASLLLPARNFSRVLIVSEPNAGADAPAGASAFARAADRTVGELGRWISTHPDCN